MATQTQPPASRSAARYTALSALLARQGASESLKVWRNPLRFARTLIRFQAIGAALADRGVAQMLGEQSMEPEQLARINPPAFTTGPASIEERLAAITAEIEAEAEQRIERMAESLIQEASRAAQQAAVTVRDDVQWVRHLTLPSCSRCAVLAGRIYRFSQGFQRHPGCDCTMHPVTVASPDYTYDPEALAREGQINGLSKADRDAIAAGASMSQVINVRRREAGLTEAGQVLERAGRPTPAGIYRLAGDDRARAIELLRQAGYLR